MRRITIALLTLVALTSTAMVSVWASSPHYKKGPTVADNGLTATASGWSWKRQRDRDAIVSGRHGNHDLL